MADAETLLMETMDQNGNEGKDCQDEAEQELMMGEEDQDDDADGGKIEATKGDEDTGWVLISLMPARLRSLGDYEAANCESITYLCIGFSNILLLLLYLQ